MPNARHVLAQAGLSALLAVLALWGATLWAAAMLGHQPPLGAAWATIAGMPVYAPWQVFAWWMAFDGQAPNVFDRAGMIAALGGVAPALIAFGGAAWRARAKSTITTYGSARWADYADIQEAGLLGERAYGSGWSPQSGAAGWRVRSKESAASLMRDHAAAIQVRSAPER